MPVLRIDTDCLTDDPRVPFACRSTVDDAATGPPQLLAAKVESCDALQVNPRVLFTWCQSRYLLESECPLGLGFDQKYFIVSKRHALRLSNLSFEVRETSVTKTHTHLSHNHIHDASRLR